MILKKYYCWSLAIPHLLCVIFSTSFFNSFSVSQSSLEHAHINATLCNQHHNLEIGPATIAISCSACIIRRFYIARRLSRLVTSKLFDFVHHKKAHITSRIQGGTLIVEHVPFTHESIKKYLNEAIRTHRMQCIKQLIAQVMQFRYVGDECFEQEALRSICVLCWRALHEDRFGAKKNNQTVALSHELIALYSDLSHLSIEETMQLIDLFVDQAPTFLEKVEFFSYMNWKTWLKKYWWAPPLFILFIAHRFHAIFPNLTTQTGLFSWWRPQSWFSAAMPGISAQPIVPSPYPVQPIPGTPENFGHMPGLSLLARTHGGHCCQCQHNNALRTTV